MQYILIETEPTVVSREVMPTGNVGVLTTGQIEALTVTDTIPGVRLYQCIGQDGTVAYKTTQGQPFNLACGSSVVDANPPIPLWDEPEVPVVPVVEQTPRIITKLDYMNRFHDDELAALYGAAKTVVQIEVWLEKFKMSEHIDLNDPRTIGGVQALESAGLIAQGRANEILA